MTQALSTAKALDSMVTLTYESCKRDPRLTRVAEQVLNMQCSLSAKWASKQQAQNLSKAAKLVILTDIKRTPLVKPLTRCYARISRFPSTKHAFFLRKPGKASSGSAEACTSFIVETCRKFEHKDGGLLAWGERAGDSTGGLCAKAARYPPPPDPDPMRVAVSPIGCPAVGCGSVALCPMGAPTTPCSAAYSGVLTVTVLDAG